MIDIKVPPVGESITEVTLIKWIKQDGEWVERDEILCELESEKATFELNAEQAGILKHAAKEGDNLNIGDLACSIDDKAERPAELPKKEETAAKAEQAADAKPVADTKPTAQETAKTEHTALPADVKMTPVAHNIVADKKLDVSQLHGSGSLGKITKNDVLSSLEKPGTVPGKTLFSREEPRTKMSNLRKTVSRRLVEAKNTTAMLTTFNEVDMGGIMDLRTKYKDAFKEKRFVSLCRSGRA
jgi:2-oxoglutarate dehydrogenase E2 component (dihydrolipoamide succinyltransferase)